MLATVVALAGVGVATATYAQVSSSNVPAQVSGQQLVDLDAQRQAMFKQMMADPSNVKLALKYADLSAEAGDLEGAISTLERLLILAPNLAELNFDLGKLYMRLGAFEQASTYFKVVAALPDATPDMKAQAAGYLTVANRQVAGDYVTANFQAGAQYQTNANGGVVDPLIDLDGIPFTLSSSAMASPDYNAYLSGTIHASHDLASQGDRLNLDISLYSSFYQVHHELNTLAGEIEAGPVFSLDRFSIKNATIGIYGIGDVVTLGGDPYLYAPGAGAVLTGALDPATETHSRVEYRYEFYQDSDLRPTASDMTGPRIRWTEDMQHQVNDFLSLYASVYGERKIGVDGTETDWEGSGVVGGKVLFNAGADPQRATSLDLSAGLIARRYDTADPLFSTDQRFDKVGFVQAVLDVPLGSQWSAVATAGYRKQISNYDLYTFDDISTSLALSKDF